MFGLGIGELLLILAIVVLLFGGKRLPQLGIGVGGMLKGFRKAVGGGGEVVSEPGNGDHAEKSPS